MSKVSLSIKMIKVLINYSINTFKGLVKILMYTNSIVRLLIQIKIKLN